MLWKKKKDTKKEQIRYDLENIAILIFEESRWCQRAMCKNKEGNQLFYPNDKSACQWCLLGAAYHNNVSDDTISFLNRNAIVNGYYNISHLNDQNSYKDVVNFLDLCYKSVKGK